MSGGSFNYLCDKQGVEVYEAMHDLRAMASTLDSMADDGTAGARQAAKRTRAIIDLAELVELAVSDLHDVWHAVERWCSSDWSRGDAVEALDKWRSR